ncbi:dipeptidase [Muribaculaceae bacterium Isolate-013 (NCI)]|jgi:dipeptidase|nr:dipeptidase [Muribaculaceae bacterium Isolate-013 (NCI)]
MKKFLVAAMAAALSLPAWACTSLIAAKGATADNSVMITYAADSHNLYGELYTLPGGTHAPGEMRQIIEWDTNKPLGEIPQAPVTYTRVGNMNEHGLAITESTWGGREELAGSGIIDYGSLIFLGLERAKTAREAIRIMTDLVKEYGYASSGESFSIADPDEAWILELIGKGKDDKGAVWVARRIPDGYISGHANHPRIHKFPLKDKAKETIYSPDVIKFARQKGYFNGKDEDFDFSRAYAVTDFGALRGCDARVWAYFNKFAPGMEEYLPWIDSAAGEPMPLWVKPSRPLTDNDLKWMMRDHYEGTPYDMTTDVGAGPYKVPYRWRPMTFSVDSVEYTHERAIATQQTGFSLVAQLRADLPQSMRGLLWFGTDDANTCVYLPIFCSVTKAPAQLAKGDINTFSWDSNFWVNNVVANQAYNRYSQMIRDIRRVQTALEDSIATDVRVAIEQLPEFDAELQAQLTQDLADIWAQKATDSYRRLAEFLFVKFMDGNIKKTDENGNFIKDEYGTPVYPDFGGYDDPRYFRNIVRETGDRLRVRPIEY